MKFSRIVCLLTFVVSLATPTTVLAAAEGYFRASVPVSSQSRQERIRGIEAAFLKVLVRMSGSVEIESDEEVAKKLKGAPRYIEQYKYEPLEDESFKEQGYREILTVNFSPAAVRKVLDQLQLPYWSENRPTTLVWLVQDDPENGKQLLNQYSETPVVEKLNEAAEKRGLPLSFPVLDLEDMLAVSPDDVWAINEEMILQASERYQADVVLVGRFSQTSLGEVWSIWQFFHTGLTRSYDSRISPEVFNEEQTFGEDALFPLADFLATRYAINASEALEGRLVVQLDGIGDFLAFDGALAYLDGLAAVADLHVAAVRGDSLLIFLDSDASIEKLLGAIALGDKLTPHQAPETDLPVWQQAPTGTIDNPLRFHWSS